mgnify:CR=1 FL=1
MMMTSEMETNETMQKTENTIQDVRECARPAPAALIRENALASEHAARKHLSKAKPLFKIRVRLRPQMAAVDLRHRGS